ncbi:uncharacterized protein TNCV_1626961 [Trichonephila clavipes]|nr:uncharacterized protein TNCV_1626961 [Trichonephila clavipes]
MGPSPGDGMDVCKCIGPSRQEGSLNSSRIASPLVRSVEGEERWEALDHPQGVKPQNWGENEHYRAVTCMVLKAMANERRTLWLFAMMTFLGHDLALPIMWH